MYTGILNKIVSERKQKLYIWVILSKDKVGDYYMYVKDIEIYENKPVKIVLKNLSNYLMGTFIIKDDSTISFTDRRRKTSLIGVELISLIEPSLSVACKSTKQNFSFK